MIEAASRGSVVVVGMSRAAALGVVVATTYPQLIQKLVLIGTPPSPTSTADSPGIDQEFWQRVVALIRAGDYERAMPLCWSREFSEPRSGELVETFARQGAQPGVRHTTRALRAACSSSAWMAARVRQSRRG